MNNYDVGDVACLEVAFVNSAGQQVDPSTITFQHRAFTANPSSFSTLVYGVDSITRVATGAYRHDLSITSEMASFGSDYRYRWNGFGANAAAEEGRFSIRPRHVG